jgi:hypothetical protein
MTTATPDSRSLIFANRMLRASKQITPPAGAYSGETYPDRLRKAGWVCSKHAPAVWVYPVHLDFVAEIQERYTSDAMLFEWTLIIDVPQPDGSQLLTSETDACTYFAEAILFISRRLIDHAALGPEDAADTEDDRWR